MDFDSPFNEKGLYDGDLWIDSVEEDTEFVVSYRPDQVPDFSPLRTFSLEAIGTPQAVRAGLIPTIKEGYKPRRSLGKPDNRADTEGTGRIMRRGYEFQVKVQWTGRARPRKLRLHAKILKEDTKAQV